MNQNPSQPAQEWAEIIHRLRTEVASLSATEQLWIRGRLAALSLLQREIHACTPHAESPDLCAACNEHCCGDGKNHVTLANLLFYFLEGNAPPPADFSAPCPQFGEQGCRFPPERRPFNCITFNCAAVEEQMTSEQLQRFYALEAALRALYESFDARYCGSSLRGLLIRAAGLGTRPFLERRDRH